MKILLLGEASNLHWTLAEGLRSLGHQVTVASNGSHWMDNSRDISLIRKSNGIIDSVKYLSKVLYHCKDFKGYDIVQIKNPVFFDLRPEKNLMIFRFLKKHNKKIFLSALGTDHYYVKTCLEQKKLCYSDFFINGKPLQFPERQNIINAWIGGPNEKPNHEIAQEANGIIACLYEYYISYENKYKNKLGYIPIPINLAQHPLKEISAFPQTVNFFIGIQKDRSIIKGTDILYDILKTIKNDYPRECNILKAESIPLTEYKIMMNKADVLLDQLYSYTPATNALGAMAQGIIAVSGGEAEMYDFIGEKELHPIINVEPCREDIYIKLENLIKSKRKIPQLAFESHEFIKRHHDHIKVAQQYLDFWSAH